MKKRLKRIEQHMASMDVTLAKQSIILEEHVKRSNLLEEKMAPVERHVNMVQGGMKLIGLAAVVLSILKVIGVFHG